MNTASEERVDFADRALALIYSQQKMIKELHAKNAALQKMLQEAIMKANQALDLASK